MARRATTKKHKAIAPAPCAKCPFRKDVPIYLRRDRRIEIIESALSGGHLSCHETTADAEDEDGFDIRIETADSVECAGLVKAMALNNLDTQHTRIAERLGMADVEKIEKRGADVWDIYEWQNLAEGSTGDNPIEEEEVITCTTVNEGCLAPAGYAVGGGAIEGTEPADGECSMCGEGLCSNCADSEGRCSLCTEEDEGW